MTSHRSRLLLVVSAVAALIASCASGGDAAGGDPTDGVPIATVATPVSPGISPRPGAASDPGPESNALAHRDEAISSEVLAAWRADRAVPASSAFSVVISRPGAAPIAVVSGIGADGAAVTVDDWFRLGSITKTYTATALLRLVDEGRLDLDATLDRYLTDPIGHPDLTTRHLLSHTSGLPDYLENPAWIRSILSDQTRHWSTEEILALVPRSDTVPGGFAYSNTNYVVAGQVLEAVTGLPAEAAIGELVFEPAGLRDTDTAGAGRRIVPAAIDLGDGSVVSSEDLTGYRAIETSASTAGSISATPTDLARFGRALLDGALLSDSAFAEMTATDPQRPYGLGLARWSDLGDTALVGVGNYGEIPGYSAMLLLDPASGVVIVAAGADDRATVYELAAALQAAVRG